MNVVFDTNALFYPRTLRAIAALPNTTLWGSMANVIETVSDICDGRSFSRAQSQLRLMIEVAPLHFLPDPDTYFKMAMNLAHDERNVRGWHQLAVRLAGAHSYHQILSEGLNTEAARRMRIEHDKAFIELVTEQMVRSINPKARISGSVFNIRLRGTELDELKQIMFSAEGRAGVATAWLTREGMKASDLTEDQTKRLVEFTSAFYFAYRGWVLNMFEQNAKPQANDEFDLALTLPLATDGWILVTGDKRLIRWLEMGEMPPHLWRRISDFESLTTA